MNENYSVRITPQAQAHLSEITGYIANSLQAPTAALRLLDTLEKAINSLSFMPHRIALTDEEPWKTKGIHRMVVRNFLVYFWIDEQENTVHITAVIYGRRDQAQQLAQMESE